MLVKSVKSLGFYCSTSFLGIPMVLSLRDFKNTSTLLCISSGVSNTIRDFNLGPI